MPVSSESSQGPDPVNARELQAVIRAEREGDPFFVFRDAEGGQQLIVFPRDRREVTIGRNPAADLSLSWDLEVSGLHAQMQYLAGELTLVDDGLSRNGSFVNSEPVRGRRRLRDRDRLRFGRTVVLVRCPFDSRLRTVSAVEMPVLASSLSAQQRNVLVALCRPLIHGGEFATPATNQEIADELFLSVAAVKLHLRALCEKLGIGDLPKNTKRLALAGRAVQGGLVTDRDFASTPSERDS